MDIFDILAMIGGLALFLYGMELLGEGLSKASDGKLEKILEKLTSSPIKGVLLGAGVTAVIQSSSATTVMVVGFVNSGIMKLQQAVGIIMGANIGTTATSWILSLSGIDGESFLIKMLKPTSFSPILAVIGIAMIMFSKKEKKHNVGRILVGFAILMTGMSAMSDAVKPLADIPGFTQILVMFSNPILGLLAGMLLTAIVQSSSASVGILQALCATGSVSYATVLPIIMGQNIGTCITAMISSIGASKNGKRAALVHLYFNVVGTAIFMIVFYTINAFVSFEFLGDMANEMGIAVIHTIFNIVATAILLPLNKMLEKLAYLTIKETPEEREMLLNMDEFAMLDDIFLEQPGLAIEHCRKVISNMVVLVKKALSYSFELFEEYTEEKDEKVSILESRIDKYEDELETYILKISSKDLSEKDTETVSMLLHAVSNFESISDHASKLAAAAKKLYSGKLEFSEKASKELGIFRDAVSEIVDNTCKAFDNNDAELAKMIEPLEQVIDDLNRDLKERHIRRLTEGKCTIDLGFIHSDIITSYERISDHCSNIAVSIIQLKQEGIDPHDYIDKIKRGDNEFFKRNYSKYKVKYELPETRKFTN